MNVSVARIYDYVPPQEGTALLVDRLWPRGIAKASTGDIVWCKDLAPSNQLRRWFHEDKPSRYTQFATLYRQELDAKTDQLKQIIQLHQPPLLLLTAVKEIDQSHIPTLQDFLETF